MALGWKELHRSSSSLGYFMCRKITVSFNFFFYESWQNLFRKKILQYFIDVYAAFHIFC